MTFAEFVAWREVARGGKTDDETDTRTDTK